MRAYTLSGHDWSEVLDEALLTCLAGARVVVEKAFGTTYKKRTEILNKTVQDFCNLHPHLSAWFNADEAQRRFTALGNYEEYANRIYITRPRTSARKAGVTEEAPPVKTVVVPPVVEVPVVTAPVVTEKIQTPVITHDAVHDNNGATAEAEWAEESPDDSVWRYEDMVDDRYRDHVPVVKEEVHEHPQRKPNVVVNKLVDAINTLADNQADLHETQLMTHQLLRQQNSNTESQNVLMLELMSRMEQLLLAVGGSIQKPQVPKELQPAEPSLVVDGVTAKHGVYRLKGSILHKGSAWENLLKQEKADDEKQWERLFPLLLKRWREQGVISPIAVQSILIFGWQVKLNVAREVSYRLSAKDVTWIPCEHSNKIIANRIKQEHGQIAIIVQGGVSDREVQLAKERCKELRIVSYVTSRPREINCESVAWHLVKRVFPDAVQRMEGGFQRNGVLLNGGVNGSNSIQLN